MPVIYGNVAGRQHNPVPIPRKLRYACSGLPVQMWEQLAVWRWEDEHVTIEEMSRRLLRTVAEVVAMLDGARIRRSDG